MKRNVRKPISGKFILMLALSGLLLFVLAVYRGGTEKSIIEDQLLLMQTLREANIQPHSVTVHYGDMLRDDATDQDIITMKGNLERLFSLQLTQVSGLGQQEVMKFQGITKLNSGADVQLLWIGYQRNPENPSLYEGYLSVDVSTLDTDPEQIKALTAWLSKKLGEIKVESKLNTTIQGSTDQILNTEEQYQWVSGVLEQLRVQEVIGTKEDSLVSLSGYSSQFNQSVTTGDKQMNIQMATHIDHLNQRMVVTIGSPLITTEM